MSARTKAGRVRLERDIAELGAVLRQDGRARDKGEVLAELRRRLHSALVAEREATKIPHAGSHLAGGDQPKGA